MKPLLLISLVVSTLPALRLGAQSVNFDPFSPEVPGVSASHHQSFDADCGSEVVWSDLDLGIPGGGNIDAISTASNVFPIIGPFFPNWNQFHTQRTVWVGFSVDRATIGMGAVLAQSSGNGAASDKFFIEMDKTPGVAILYSDHHCITPKPGETDIDGLVMGHTTGYPVYFSVDLPTAVMMGVSPADILVVADAGGPVEVFKKYEDFGLLPGDDIDALAVGSGGILYSLKRGSPTATANPMIGSGGLFINGLMPWASAFQMSLKPDDDLNALYAMDPSEQHCGDYIPGKGIMCRNSTTGSTTQTSVWRVFSREELGADAQHGYRLTGVSVGAEIVEDVPFDVEVRIYEAATDNPAGAKTLVARETQTFRPGYQAGYQMPYDGLDRLIYAAFVWVEIYIPQSSNYPNSGRFYWAGTDCETAPTYYSSEVCGPFTPQTLASMGFPNHALILRLHGSPEPGLQLTTNNVASGQIADFTVTGMQPFETGYVAYSLTGVGYGVVVPALGNLRLDLLAPATLLGTFQADANGSGTLSAMVPNNLPPMLVFTQAVVRRGAGGIGSQKSNYIGSQL